MSRKGQSSSSELPVERHRLELIVKIVIAVIGAVGLVVAAWISTRGESGATRPGMTAMTTAPPPSVVSVTASDSLEPMRIWDVLDSTPVLRQAAVANARFVGLSVNWSGVVHSVRTESDLFRVAVRRPTGRSPVFRALLDSSDFSAVSALKVGDAVRVRGTILHASLDSGIVLRPARLVPP